MLEPIKKRYPMSKGKEEAIMRRSEGHNHDKIKAQIFQMGDPKMENNNTKEVLPLL